MAIRAWGPLFAWLVLAGAAISGLVVEHPEPHNRGQPTVAPCKDNRPTEFAAIHTDNQNGKKGEQERSWIEGLFDKPTDTLLVSFNGLLVLFTYFLYSATSGLFKETAELRRIADEQRVDLSRSIAAAEKSADAAKQSADAAMKIELPSIELAQFKLLMVTNLKDVNGVPIERGTNLPEFCGLVVNFTNSGRTSAQTFEQCVEWRVCKDLPPVPEYMHQTHFPPGQLLKRRMTTGSLIGNNFQFSADERSAISDGTQFLWVYCYLRYLDFVGVEHEKRFCARWLGEHPHFGTPVGFVFDSATPPEYVKSY